MYQTRQKFDRLVSLLHILNEDGVGEEQAWSDGREAVEKTGQKYDLMYSRNQMQR